MKKNKWDVLHISNLWKLSRAITDPSLSPALLSYCCYACQTVEFTWNGGRCTIQISTFLNHLVLDSTDKDKDSLIHSSRLLLCFSYQHVEKCKGWQACWCLVTVTKLFGGITDNNNTCTLCKKNTVSIGIVAADILQYLSLQCLGPTGRPGGYGVRSGLSFIIPGWISCLCTHASIHIHKSFPPILLLRSRNLHRHSEYIRVLKGQACSSTPPPHGRLQTSFWRLFCVFNQESALHCRANSLHPPLPLITAVTQGLDNSLSETVVSHRQQLVGIAIPVDNGA